MATAAVWSLAVSPGDPNLIVAGLGPPEDAGDFYDRGVRLSWDGGASWHAPPLGTEDNRNRELSEADFVTAVAFSHSEPDTVLAAAWGQGLLVSRDRGNTWQYAPSPGGQRGYFEAMLTHAPAGAAGCELLHVAGANGVWYVNLTGDYHTLYVPQILKNTALD